MAKKVIAAANNKEQKYFMEEEFKFLPDAIKDDLKKICIMMAEKLKTGWIYQTPNLNTLKTEMVI